MTVNTVLIVGGGTAGWMTAVYLASTVGADSQSGLSITLVESDDVPTVGVGEGTFPSIKTTLDAMGIRETEFIKACDATFKQGIRFNNWTHDPIGKPDDYYQHLFDNCHQMQGRHSLAPYWALGLKNDVPYSEAVTLQHVNCALENGPKTKSDQEYFGGFQYAYHLDAGKLASFLKTKALELGVRHIIGTIKSVDQSECGSIESVYLENSDSLTADLFVDCTGFAALLIGKTLKEPITSVTDTLFVDRAVTVHMPYADEDSPIPSTTITTAHEAGWTWDIGLKHRRGIGYVYSSAHSKDDRAIEVLKGYIGEEDNIDVSLIKMKTGYRKNQWVKNCVSVGLAGGFLEPLEATGIIFIESALWLLSQYFPRQGNMEVVAKQFNRALETRYANAISFLKMHYCLSQRTDHEFWADNRRQETIPCDLKEKLAIWKYRMPHRFDFNLGHETFGEDSHRYILLGMGHVPDLSANKSAYSHGDMAQRHFKLIADATKNAVSQMMSHRDLVEGIHRGTVTFT